MQDKWATISENLQKTLDSGTFKVWIAPLRVSVQEREICLSAPNAFVANWLETRMMPALREAAAPVLGLEVQAVEVRVEVCPDLAPAQAAEAAVPNSPATAGRPASPLRFPLPPGSLCNSEQSWRYSFEDFEVGSSNSMAVAAARAVCDGGTVSALFVNAGPGLGKTHLAHAVGRAISQSPEKIRVAYMTAEEFVRHYASALQRKTEKSFREHLAAMDVLLLEDVHFLQGQKKGYFQEMALATLKTLQGQGGKVVCTSSFSPRELQDMDSSLISQFCSGILTAMERPSRDMRRRILQRKAEHFQMPLPDDVCELLAQRLHGDVRQLESCLNSLVFKARLLNCCISRQLAMDVLKQYAGVECGADMETFVQLVCESFGLTRRQLDSKSRRHDCVTGRNTIYYLARKHTALSLEEIGSTFNRRHSTVIKGITSVEREISKESSLGRQLVRAVRLIERNAGLSTTT